MKNWHFACWGLNNDTHKCGIWHFDSEILRVTSSLTHVRTLYAWISSIVLTIVGWNINKELLPKIRLSKRLRENTTPILFRWIDWDCQEDTSTKQSLTKKVIEDVSNWPNLKLREDVERFHFGERAGGEAAPAARGVGEGPQAGGPGKGAGRAPGRLEVNLTLFRMRRTPAESLVDEETCRPEL